MADQDPLQAEEKLIEEEVASHQPEISLDQPYPAEVHMEDSAPPAEPTAAPAPEADVKPLPAADPAPPDAVAVPDEKPKKANFFARLFKHKKK